MNNLIERNVALEALRFSAKDGDKKLCARILNASDETAIGKLRHQFFVEDCKWVPENPSTPGLELDRFDPFATHLGIFCDEDLVAYMRLLPSDTPVNWMLDTDFRVIMNETEYLSLLRENAIEISRLVLAKTEGDQLQVAETAAARMRLLFKLFYHVCLTMKWTRYYAVVQPMWVRAVRKHFPWFGFEPVSSTYKFADGTSAIVIGTDILTLERQSANHPAEHAWFTSI